MSKFKETVGNFFSLFIQDIINLLHDKDYRSYKNASNDTKQLVKTGYIAFQDFLSKEECERLYQAIGLLCKQNSKSVKLENGTYLMYRAADTANGPDKGMIDIYDIDKSIDVYLDFNYIEKIIKETTNCDVYYTSMHAYVNKGVEGTRIFHVDNSQPVVYKAFVYLTDVTDIGYGPYAFIKKTHRFSIQVYYNIIRNLFYKKYRSYDMPLYDKKREIISLGKKGTLIISNQNGIHRGYPQIGGKERVALVLNYVVISKLNYMHQTAKDAVKNSIRKL